jgi:hypothetical protein
MSTRSGIMPKVFQALRRFTADTTKFRSQVSSCIQILPEVADALSNGIPGMMIDVAFHSLSCTPSSV